MPDWVLIVHDSSPKAEPASVTKEAFEEVHKLAGWRLHKEPKPPETASPKPKPSTKKRS